MLCAIRGYDNPLCGWPFSAMEPGYPSENGQQRRPDGEEGKTGCLEGGQAVLFIRGVAFLPQDNRLAHHGAVEAYIPVTTTRQGPKCHGSKCI